MAKTNRQQQPSIYVSNACIMWLCDVFCMNSSVCYTNIWSFFSHPPTFLSFILWLPLATPRITEIVPVNHGAYCHWNAPSLLWQYYHSAKAMYARTTYGNITKLSMCMSLCSIWRECHPHSERARAHAHTTHTYTFTFGKLSAKFMGLLQCLCFVCINLPFGVFFFICSRCYCPQPRI